MRVPVGPDPGRLIALGSVSVVITTLNARSTVRDCIDSAVAGTASLCEVLVIDRGSVDGTAEIARGMGGPVRLIERPGAGAEEAVQTGTAEAAGETVVVVPSRAVVGEGALDAGVDIGLVPVGTTAFGRAAAAVVGPDVPSITVTGHPGIRVVGRPAPRSWYLVADTPVGLAAEAFHPRAGWPAAARGMLVGATAGAAIFGRGWARVALPLGHGAAMAVRALRAANDPGVAPHRAFLAAEIRDWVGGAGWWADRRKR